MGGGDAGITAGDGEPTRSEWSSDKAELRRDGDRVIKRYKQRGSAIHDAEVLRRIEERYRPFDREGWSYRALRVFGSDPSQNALTMEYVEGRDLRELFVATRDPLLFRHAGRWLGGLHAGGSPGAPDRVVIFNDFNASNVIVDAAGKQIVAIDPGGFTRLATRPGVSLAIGALSTGRNALRVDPRLVPTCLRAYLTGYLEAGHRRSLPSLHRGWAYALRRIYEGKARTMLPVGWRPARLVVGAVECAMWAVVTYAVGWWVRLTGGGPASRRQSNTRASANTNH